MIKYINVPYICGYYEDYMGPAIGVKTYTVEEFNKLYDQTPQ